MQKMPNFLLQLLRTRIYARHFTAKISIIHTITVWFSLKCDRFYNFHKKYKNGQPLRNRTVGLQISN